MIRSSFLVGLCALTTYACTNEAKPTYPQRRGGRGDSCLVLNDCKEPLLCRAGRCLDADLGLKASDKQCVMAECIDDGDCCRPISLAQEAACETNAAKCRGNAQCERTARSPCTCTRSCQAHECVTSFDSDCDADTDCGVGACSEGRCVECSADLECGEGLICEEDECRAACTRDEQCGRLARCDEGRCSARGCLSQRECILLLGRPDAECRDEACVVPCDGSAACASLGALHVCDKGVCKSLGCEENADCSARDTAQGSLMLCLDKEDVGRLRTVEPFSFMRGTRGAVP